MNIIFLSVLCGSLYCFTCLHTMLLCFELSPKRKSGDFIFSIDSREIISCLVACCDWSALPLRCGDFEFSIIANFYFLSETFSIKQFFDENFRTYCFPLQDLHITFPVYFFKYIGGYHKIPVIATFTLSSGAFDVSSQT